MNTLKKSLEKYTYEKLIQAHIKSRKGKGYIKEIIEFNLNMNNLFNLIYKNY